MVIKLDVTVTHTTDLDCPVAVFEAERLIGFRSIEKLERDFGLIQSLIIEDLDHHVRVAKTDDEAMLQQKRSVQSHECAIAITEISEMVPLIVRVVLDDEVSFADACILLFFREDDVVVHFS